MTGAFTCHPVPDVRRAVQQLDPASLAAAEEPHRDDVHQRHFLEIQSWTWLRTFDLGLDFRQALRLDPTDQPDDRAPLSGNQFDTQSHWLEVADSVTATAHHEDTENTETARTLQELWLAVFVGVVGHPF
jgi:hypothetical protein